VQMLLEFLFDGEREDLDEICSSVQEAVEDFAPGAVQVFADVTDVEEIGK